MDGRDLDSMKLWGIKEISIRFAVSPQVAHQWSQHKQFPEVYEKMLMGPCWRPNQVIAWYVEYRGGRGSP